MFNHIYKVLKINITWFACLKAVVVQHVGGWYDDVDVGLLERLLSILLNISLLILSAMITNKIPVGYCILFWYLLSVFHGYSQDTGVQWIKKKDILKRFECVVFTCGLWVFVLVRLLEVVEHGVENYILVSGSQQFTFLI